MKTHGCHSKASRAPATALLLMVPPRAAATAGAFSAQVPTDSEPALFLAGLGFEDCSARAVRLNESAFSEGVARLPAERIGSKHWCVHKRSCRRVLTPCSARADGCPPS